MACPRETTCVSSRRVSATSIESTRSCDLRPGLEHDGPGPVKAKQWVSLNSATVLFMIRPLLPSELLLSELLLSVSPVVRSHRFNNTSRRQHHRLEHHRVDSYTARHQTSDERATMLPDLHECKEKHCSWQQCWDGYILSTHRVAQSLRPPTPRARFSASQQLRLLSIKRLTSKPPRYMFTIMAMENSSASRWFYIVSRSPCTSYSQSRLRLQHRHHELKH